MRQPVQRRYRTAFAGSIRHRSRSARSAGTSFHDPTLRLIFFQESRGRGRCPPAPLACSDSEPSVADDTVFSLLAKRTAYAVLFANKRSSELYVCLRPYRCAAARRNRKKFVAIAKRCERACKRTAEQSVTFCGKGGAAACACSDFQKEIGASDIKLAPMWRARHDSNVRPTESESVALSSWATGTRIEYYSISPKRCKGSSIIFQSQSTGGPHPQALTPG